MLAGWLVIIDWSVPILLTYFYFWKVLTLSHTIFLNRKRKLITRFSCQKNILIIRFKFCNDENEHSPSEIEYVLVLKRWSALQPSKEFRCFVQDNQIIGKINLSSSLDKWELFFTSISHYNESIKFSYQPTWLRKLLPIYEFQRRSNRRRFNRIF